jgi:hypothetical protein
MNRLYVHLEILSSSEMVNYSLEMRLPSAGGRRLPGHHPQPQGPEVALRGPRRQDHGPDTRPHGRAPLHVSTVPVPCWMDESMGIRYPLLFYGRPWQRAKTT